MSDDAIRFTLRPYQEDAIERMMKAEARGVRKQLGVAATGLGKTVIFCSLAAQRGGRALFLAHRDELVAQARKKVTEIWPDVDVGTVKAEANDVHAKVVVGSVQTLARERRLQRLVDASTPGHSLIANSEPFDLVVVDEAHHSAADSYRKIISELRAGEDGGPLLLGVTATPDRGDGQGLDDLFDEIVWNYDILWGIRSGFLADVRAKRIVLDRFNIGDVKVRRGEYDAGSAGMALELADAPEHIVAAWMEHARERQTLVFTPTVALAEHVRDAYRHRGIKAAMVCASTPLDERRQMLHDYATGSIQVIANCAVLTEGFDEPRTDCVVVARPTKSRALFTQMIGRGTRKHPAKDHLLVLDVVGNSNVHSIVTVPSLFGIPEEDAHEVTRQNLTDVVDEIERQAVAAGRLKAEEANLFAAMRAQGIAWVRVRGNDGRLRFQRPLPGLPTVVLAQRDTSDEESWACWLRYEDEFVGTARKVRPLISDVSFDLAQGVGEDACRKQLKGRTAIIDLGAAWRKKPPSDKAKRMARWLRIPNVESFKTAGELSEAIDEAKARRDG